MYLGYQRPGQYGRNKILEGIWRIFTGNFMTQNINIMLGLTSSDNHIDSVKHSSNFTQIHCIEVYSGSQSIIAITLLSYDS